MGQAQAEIKKAVDCRLLARCTASIPSWLSRARTRSLWTPRSPTESYQDFLKGEVRYASLAKMFPDVAEGLFEKNEADALAKYAKYKSLAE